MLNTNTPKVLLTHPGNQYCPLLATALHQRGLLYTYAAGLIFPDEPEAWWWQLLKQFNLSKLTAHRLAKGVGRQHLHLQPLPELWAMLRWKLLHHPNDLVFYQRNEWFQKRIPTQLIANSDVIVGFDTSSWLLVDRAAKAGKPFILDASIAHPLAKEATFQAIRHRFPAWANELAPKATRNIDVELEEMAKADAIVAASGFTRNTYIQQGIHPDKIFINPYGTNLAYFTNKWESVVPEAATIPQKGAITFFFFGAITARKGFPWLCEVWKKLHLKYPKATLLAAGYGAPPAGFRVPDGITLAGVIPATERNEWFAKADVFVFPSFFEGFAQVIIEAMACGLPVITTTHTAGPDIITEGIEGHLVEPGDDNALLQAMIHFLEQPDCIEPMGSAARAAVAPYTWAAYGERWEKIIYEVLS